MAEYSTAERYRKQRERKAKLQRLGGHAKWVGGEPTQSYARSGYAWLNGERVKVDPRASGVTQRFDYSRAQEREDSHHLAHPGKGRPKREGQRPRSSRSRAKALAREQYERAKPINAQRLKALKADRQAARMAREAWQPVIL